MDGVTGENVSYTYDSLNRLIAASTAGTTGVQWGNSYSYDGFGNLTAKVVTKGTAPSVYPQVNSATNQARVLYDNGFDPNGNWLGTAAAPNTWNVENQLISNGSVDGSGNLLTYTYDPWGKRVMQFSTSPGSAGSGTLYFYSITGQRLGTYELVFIAPWTLVMSGPQPMYFGKRLLAWVDRLGSVRVNRSAQSFAYYPWGEERTSTPDGQDKFATYFRDVSTDGVGEDYANARYYNNNFGRFWSPDPKGVRAARPKDPTSWNRYVYAGDDPVNRNDPSGLDPCTFEDGSGVTIDCPTYSGTGTDSSDGGGGSQCTESGATCSPPSAPCSNPTGCPSVSASPGSSNQGSSNQPTMEQLLSELASAVWGAEELIAAKPKCAKLFGGATLAIDTLQDLYNTDSIDFGALLPTNGNVTNAVTTPETKSTFGVPDSSYNWATITINDTNGTFVNGTATDQVVTLLHELGHAENDIYGNGTSGIVDDSGSTRASLLNTSTVKFDCL